ncbi:ELM1/GtrOC1 family putative glycosyltransferase [Acetobacter fallax]|uniref:Uncharacterized protein n=1 Tax=Acetobacter fallax TaxID=1737473 RepID=A0ABX0K622_9PROT|nr:ELM1/GtrOC1 family putative glycosyltransferase [Acetobacter fallax]NHO31268.1 hypothetical protein [Acetobacter fallax]NHO34825.1 hypothetical protein [Acetobacter fallax]
MMVQETTCDVPLWVIESSVPGRVGPAHALASRFDCSFRRMRDLSNAEAGWRPPRLMLTSGIGAGLAGLALRRRFGAPVVHCSSGRLATALTGGRPFDAVILPLMHRSSRASTHIIPVLGPLTIVSAELCKRARRLWIERLEHLPEPRVAVVLDAGEGLTPAEADAAARRLGLMVQDYRGSVLLSVSEGVPEGIADVFIEALGSCYKLVWRHGEPDDNPTLGFIGCANAVVVYGGRAVTLAETAATDLPVFLGHVPGRFGQNNRMARALVSNGYARIFDSDFSPWPREALDEAGRVASLLRTRFGL